MNLLIERLVIVCFLYITCVSVKESVAAIIEKNIVTGGIRATHYTEPSRNTPQEVERGIEVAHYSKPSRNTPQEIGGRIGVANYSEPSRNTPQEVEGGIEVAHYSEPSRNTPQEIGGGIGAAHYSEPSRNTPQEIGGGIGVAHYSEPSGNTPQEIGGGIGAAHYSEPSRNTPQEIGGGIGAAHYSEPSRNTPQEIGGGIGAAHYSEPSRNTPQEIGGGIGAAHYSEPSHNTPQEIGGGIGAAHYSEPSRNTPQEIGGGIGEAHYSEPSRNTPQEIRGGIGAAHYSEPSHNTPQEIGGGIGAAHYSEPSRNTPQEIGGGIGAAHYSEPSRNTPQEIGGGIGAAHYSEPSRNTPQEIGGGIGAAHYSEPSRNTPQEIGGGIGAAHYSEPSHNTPQEIGGGIGAAHYSEPSRNTPQEKPKPIHSCMATATKINGGNQVCAGQVIFEESFDNELDKNYWTKVIKFADAPDDEFVVYLSDSDTLVVQEGNLKIKPTLLAEKYNDDDIVNQQLDLRKSCTGIKGSNECYREAVNYFILPPVVSGRINTKGKFSFLYGKVEIRAKLPTGDWIYPELYLSPEEEYYGPNYASGLMRVAYMPGNSADRKTISGGVVLGETSEARIRFMKSYSVSHVPSWASDYHTFVLEWKPDVIELSVDGQKYAELRPPLDGFAEFGEKFKQKAAAKLWKSGTILAPFDKEFYLDIGVGVGGENFPDSTHKPWKNTSPKGMLDFWNKKNTWLKTWDDNSQLQVDYIKVTAL